jgi:hypothetical protein
MRPILLLILASLTLAGPARAALDARAAADALPPVRAVRLTDAVTIDGALDEPVWRGAPAITRLTQSDPYEDSAPSESTWVWVAYDDDALYVAARCWDAHPDSIVASLVRRDLWVPSDRVVVYLDPFRDLRSGYFFSVSAAGVLWDGTLYNDVASDDSWDGVWQGRARRDGGTHADDRSGWTCEMRIPFSQLRFRPGSEQVWGFNFRRRIERRSELDQLAWTPKKGSGFVSRFPRLVGVEDGHRSRSIEALPYTTGKAEYLAHAPGDPFHDGSRYTPGMGGDLRMSAGNNLTLNATVNPDFSQVEVDPAVVNLSDVESFFQEKRPFFTENARIFGFGNEGANHYWGFNWPEPRFFYSRRIGRAPQGGAPFEADFSDVPVATHILGAAKLTGKLSPSLNFGTLHALTGREEAKYSVDGVPARTEVEPSTYYGVARGLKELKGGYNGVGLMTTLVQRRFAGSALQDLLNEQSLMTGLDGWHFLDRRKLWVLSGWAAMSRVAGTEARMSGLQGNSLHYLQRPDREHYRVDSTATSLTGYGARVWLNKQEGNLISNSAIGFMDPRFDVNDMGYQMQADVVTAHTGLQYHFTKPNRVQREAWLGEVVFESRDFDGHRTGAGYWQGYTANFANDYTLDSELMFVPLTVNDRRTRGGPVMKELTGTYWSLTLGTAARNRLVYSLHADQTTTPSAGHTDYWDIYPAVEWKPATNFSIQVGPNYSRAIENAQYVRTVAAPGEVPADLGDQRYVFARMDQTLLSADIRLDVSFSTTLTMQTYIQPLICAGRYTDFKELARAGSYDFIHYGASYDPATRTVTPAGGKPFRLRDPSFNSRSLRGNAVLRWEYRPGSVLYFVWTQQRTDQQAFGDLRLGPSTRRLFDAQANDVFLVKATYYLGL